jgi:hypothetical protein
LAFADDTTHHLQPLLPLKRGVVSRAGKDLCSGSWIVAPPETAKILRCAQDDRRLIFHTF